MTLLSQGDRVILDREINFPDGECFSVGLLGRVVYASDMSDIVVVQFDNGRRTIANADDFRHLTVLEEMAQE